MNLLPLLGGLAGGVGLFLLGMGLMTDGLKLAAGPALERILARSTQTRLRGLATGALVTIAVQSSSAVTVAAIGFVNAGLLTLSQALWVLFGANVGTTMTGWLVALVGMKFSIDIFALPLIGLGMLLRLTGEGTRRAALGSALAGFGVLFLGIDLLKDTFSGAAADFRLPHWEGAIGIVAMVLVGILMTVLMQASAASLVIAFSAAQSGLVSIEAAAAVVIGANVGTTVTALLAAIGATSNAKRAAAAHILFNVLTGIVALLLLPWLLGLLGSVRELLGLDSARRQAGLVPYRFQHPWRVADLAARRLADQVSARPLPECRGGCSQAALPRQDDPRRACPGARCPGPRSPPSRQAVAGDGACRDRRIAAAGAWANAQPASGGPARCEHCRFHRPAHPLQHGSDSARRLPELLRLARYYEAAAELAAEAGEAVAEAGGPPAGDAPASQFRDCARPCSTGSTLKQPADVDSREAAYRAAQESYHALKAHWLEASGIGIIPVTAMDAHLRAASALRRALEQLAKAAQRQEDLR